MAEAQTLEGDPGKAISHLLISGGGSDLKCTEVVVVDRHIPEVVNRRQPTFPVCPDLRLIS
jgi:hypothetical protein